MADSRKAIHAYLTPEAHDRWHDFAAEEGVSVSGLLEAIARDWKDQLDAGAASAAERPNGRPPPSSWAPPPRRTVDPRSCRAKKRRGPGVPGPHQVVHFRIEA